MTTEKKARHEEWRQLPFAPQISVSNLGRLRGPKGICKCSVTQRGYLRKVMKVNGKQKGFMVHRLVLTVFEGPYALHINHKNGIKTDNRLENLEYVTQAENNKHAWKTGLFKKYPSFAKITKEQVLEIRRRFVPGVNKSNRGNGRELAKEFGISYQTVNHIVARRRWTHV